MKQRLIVCLVVMLTVICALTGMASANTIDNYNIAIELSPAKLAEPKDIAVSIKVTNVGDTDMPGPVTLYYSNGKQVEEFGSPTLTAGSSRSWSGTYSVTQQNLQDGKITFKLKYSIYNDAGDLINKTINFSREIEYTGAVTNVEINRTITPTTARKGQEVTVTYDVINAGNVDISNVTIKENSSISTKTGKINAVAAGEKASYTFTTTMGKKNLTSSATITYVADGKKTTEKKPEATIKYGEIKLTASLEADGKGGAAGDTIKLTLKLKNSGTVDFNNLTVTDPTLGEVFTGQSVAAGKTLTLEKEITIAQSADYQFTVKGEDASGNAVDTATERVSITAIDPSEVVLLKVEAAADKETVYQLPGTVRFRVKVTNASTIDVKDVTVSASGVNLYTFPSILAGETREFIRDVQVSMAGQFRFDARVKNKLNETDVFESNIIRIAHELPTTVPTDAPIVTPPKPVYEDMPTSDGLPGYVSTLQNTMNILYTVFMVLGAVCLTLLAIGAVRRVQSAAESAKAQDHLERGTYRDYTQPAPKEKKQKHVATKDDPVTRPIGEDKETPDIPPVGATADEVADGDLMAETLRKLYPNESKANPAVTVEVEADENGEAAKPSPTEEVTSRRRTQRRS